ncbi:MAG: histidine phosphatase family protein [Steroidobacteraceae bacterium]
MSLRQRQVILVRHAHADKPGYSGPDFDRPLTPQGLADAGSTAAAIRDAAHQPDLLLTSPARRTVQTAEIIAAKLNLPAAAVQQVDALYNAGPTVLQDELRLAFSTASFVLVVAHNPGISELARMLTGDLTFDAFRPAHWLHAAWRED